MEFSHEQPALRTAEAGRAGDGVRADLRVRFEPRDGGPPEIVLERSKVAPFYGRSIREQAREVLDRLGVRSGRLTIEDEGALPLTIAARIECVVRRAGHPVPSPVLPGPVPARPPAPRDRLRRSRLYLPGHEPKLLVNAGLHGADGLILDLEDSVPPDAKDAARLLVRNALVALDFGAAERMVRINQLPAGLGDLDEIVPVDPDLVLIPKVESPDQVREVEARIEAIRRRTDRERPVWLMPILESALGIERAYEIASAADSVVALTVGLEDYTADLGVTKTREGGETLWARQRVVNAARAAGVEPIDSVWGDVADVEGLEAWARASRSLGFVGMGCVHPRQIPIVHQAFAPTREEIDRALRIVAAWEDARARGVAVVALGSKMIDPPVVERAFALVDRARRMGLVDDAARDAGSGR
ncbi:MAG: citrate lyase ACP [Acidobacteria bacterium]|nr:MAG: citrate lyase ACP [Acidobacteriota bacterium]